MLVEKYNNLNKQNSNNKLDKYLGTKTLQRLIGKSLFCGMDYVGINNLRPNEYYSRFDHSKNVALYCLEIIRRFKCYSNWFIS